MKKADENTILLEEKLYELRKGKNFSYLELVERMQDEKITEELVKKWEKGLAYPDINQIYKLSEIYQVASSEFLKAKQNSFQKGMNSIHRKLIKWICISFHITLKAAEGILILFYSIALILSFLFFITMCQMVG